MTFTDVYGTDTALALQAKERFATLAAAFEKRYGISASDSSLRYFTSAGRTEIGGNHTDHNWGKVLAASIELDCIGVVAPAEDTITIVDLVYNEDFEINVNDSTRHPEEKGSIALLRGIVQAFKDRGHNVGGFKAAFSSTVIAAAGVSSSASFEMMLCQILNCLYNNGELSVPERAICGQFAENKYWDKASGLLDQMACATGGMVAMDFGNPAAPVVEPIPFDFGAQGYSMMIVNTGKGHADLSAEYSSIPVEMKKVAAQFGKETLRGLTFADIAGKLPELRATCGDRAIMRAFHFLEENDRVDAESAALRNNDFGAFLALITESGNSSWKWLQNICVPGIAEEQPIAICLALTEHFIKTKGLKAACRVHGGGFAGVIQAFIPNEAVDEYTGMMEKALGYEKDSGKRSPVFRMGIRSTGSEEIEM